MGHKLYPAQRAGFRSDSGAGRARQATPRLTQCGYMGDGAEIVPAMKAICFDPLLSDPVIQVRPAAAGRTRGS
jgi:hypothetical protein